MSDSDSDYFGPPLPPSMAPQQTAETKKRSKSSSDTSDSDSSSSSPSDIDRTCRRRKKVKSAPVKIGPQIPEGTTTSSFIGPVAPARSDSDEECCVGPMPALADDDEAGHFAELEIELRAQRMKEKLEREAAGAVAERETWMLELPSAEISKEMGLTARQFRKDGAFNPNADRSSWTDTPADKERKAREGASSTSQCTAAAIASSRDEFFSEQVDSFNKSTRSESLMEMHLHKMNKKRKKEEKKKRKKEKKEKKSKHKKDKKEKKPEKPERRPFDRDVDLQANKLDAAQRRNMIKQSMQLNTKFGRGHQQFL